MPKGNYNAYSGMGAPKKSATGSKEPAQGKIAGETARTDWPTGSKKDPHSEYKATTSKSEGIGVNQAKGEGNQGKKMRWSRMT